MLCGSYDTTKGELYLVIEKPDWETDSFHKYARIYVRIKELDSNVICFDMMPF